MGANPRLRPFVILTVPPELSVKDDAKMKDGFVVFVPDAEIPKESVLVPLVPIVRFPAIIPLFVTWIDERLAIFAPKVTLSPSSMAKLVPVPDPLLLVCQLALLVFQGYGERPVGAKMRL